MADISGVTDKDDVAFASELVRDYGVAAVPGSSFYRPGRQQGDRLIRFAYCKTMDVLAEARRRLLRLQKRSGRSGNRPR